MEMEKDKSLIEKMKYLQILYNLMNAGVKIPNNINSLDKDFDTSIIKSVEEWAEKIFEENKDMFKDKSKQEFINFILYGTAE